MSNFQAQFNKLNNDTHAQLTALDIGNKPQFQDIFNDYSSQFSDIVGAINARATLLASEIKESARESKPAVAIGNSHAESSARPPLITLTTVTSELTSQITQAIKAIPIYRRQPPENNAAVSDPQLVFDHINDYAFTRGYAFIKFSASKDRWRFNCIYHQKKTRNTRGLEEEDRRRTKTFIRGSGCPVQHYVSRQKLRGNQWIVCYEIEKDLNHNHPPDPDPFQLDPHHKRIPKYLEAHRVASTLRGSVSFAKANEILEKQGLEIGRKEFYNLLRKEEQGQLQVDDKAQLLLAFLEAHNYHIVLDKVYTIDENRDRKDRVIRAIAWFSSEQIIQGRRFVSGALVAMDATFNTEASGMLLQNVVSVDNTGTTFPMMQVYHTSEDARTFRFIMSI
jgi:hypothetical protein